MKFIRIMSVTMLAAGVLCTLCGCKPDQGNNGKLKVVAGLPPVAGLVKAVGGDRVEVISILPQGKTPHDFEPTPQTIRQTSGAKVFFTTRMPFEDKIAGRMQKQSKICDVSTGIDRIAFDDGVDHRHHHHGENCSHDSHDPHVWLSPHNAITIADNIRAELTAADPDGAAYYQKNFDTVKERLLALDKKTADKLARYQGRTFFVYHPAFGYFAHTYNLHQRAVELNGREISTNQLSAIIKEAESADVSTIFVQEQFNPHKAEAIAKQMNVKVVPLDPLAEDVFENLEKIANSLEAGFAGEK